MGDLPVFDHEKSPYVPKHGDHFLFNGREVILNEDPDAEQAYLTDSSGVELVEETISFCKCLFLFYQNLRIKHLVDKVMVAAALEMLLEELESIYRI